MPVEGFNVYEGLQEKETGWLSKLKQLNFPKAYDRYLNQIIGEDTFTAYVDLMDYYQKIIITHSKCAAFHFIEEGNSAYQAVDDLKDLTWNERQDDFRVKDLLDGVSLKAIIRALRGYNLRLLGIPYLYSAFTHFENIRFFSFSDNAFYNAPKEKKILVKPDEEDENMLKLAAGTKLQHEIVWVDGSNNRYTGLSEQYYHDAIEKAIHRLEEKKLLKDKIYVKLRPGLKDVMSNHLVKTITKRGYKAIPLSDSMVLESFFIVSQNCIVLGTLSAALEYAHVFGHKAYSIYGLFEKQPPTFFDRMHGFWENVEKL